MTDLLCPLNWHKRFVISPFFYDGGLKPIIFKVGVVENDELKTPTDIPSHRVHEFKKIVHSATVCILQRVNATILIGFGRIMSLRGLIKDEKARDWMILLSEPTVQSKESDDMIPDPVLSTANSVERNRTINRFSDNREFFKIETNAPLGMFEIKFGSIVCHIVSDQVEKGIDAFFYIVGADKLIKRINLLSGFGNKLFEIVALH